IIDHGNGVSTLYAHASSLCVRAGDKVSAGDVIALVGSTGYSTGNHLHFEVHIGENRVNPQPYIGL
ncbi:MAG: M23 family metallopeptidase, partial [Clostridia bacterium]|nr:M23 family metallopeptidase [Clostridia bacterium]